MGYYTYYSLYIEGKNGEKLPQDMCALSYKFPGVLFSLYGEGEDRPDIWVEYFFEGLSQYEGVEIEYERFDPAKLRRYDDQSIFSPNRKYSYER